MVSRVYGVGMLLCFELLFGRWICFGVVFAGWCVWCFTLDRSRSNPNASQTRTRPARIGASCGRDGRLIERESHGGSNHWSVFSQSRGFPRAGFHSARSQTEIVPRHWRFFGGRLEGSACGKDLNAQFGRDSSDGSSSGACRGRQPSSTMQPKAMEGSSVKELFNAHAFFSTPDRGNDRENYCAWTAGARNINRKDKDSCSFLILGPRTRDWTRPGPLRAEGE